jgi:methylmalonyl-CoA mutase N-terminal domain/subunit
LTRIDPEIEKIQKQRLANVRRNRDTGRCKQALGNLSKVAKSRENTMQAILECVEAYASVGEICDVLRTVFGTQKEFLIF